jgi:hypothetical protein
MVWNLKYYKISSISFLSTQMMPQVANLIPWVLLDAQIIFLNVQNSGYVYSWNINESWVYT